MLSPDPLQIPLVEGQGSPHPARHTGRRPHTLYPQVWVSRHHWSAIGAGRRALEALLAEVKGVFVTFNLGQAKVLGSS